MFYDSSGISGMLLNPLRTADVKAFMIGSLFAQEQRFAQKSATWLKPRAFGDFYQTL